MEQTAIPISIYVLFYSQTISGCSQKRMRNYELCLKNGMLSWAHLGGVALWMNMFIAQQLRIIRSFPKFRSMVTRRGHKQGIKILGTWITLDESFGVEVGHRIHKAWGSFWKFQPVLCAFTQHLVSRIRVLDKSVKPTLFYASGSWHLIKTQIPQLSSLQFKMIRK